MQIRTEYRPLIPVIFAQFIDHIGLPTSQGANRQGERWAGSWSSSGGGRRKHAEMCTPPRLR